MAHNTQLNAGTGGDIAVTTDLAAPGARPSTGKVAAGEIWVAPSATTSPVVVTPANPFPVGGGVASGVADAGNPVKVGGVYNSSAPTLTNGQRGDAQLDSSANVKVNLATALPAGTNTIGGTTHVASATGGATPSTMLIAAGSTNATNVKASAGTVYGVQCANTNAAARYLKLYDKASTPTVGSDTPVKTFYLPPTSNIFLNFPVGVAFASGIGFATTTAAATADTGAVTAGDVILNLDYK